MAERDGVVARRRRERRLRCHQRHEQLSVRQAVAAACIASFGSAPSHGRVVCAAAASPRSKSKRVGVPMLEIFCRQPGGVSACASGVQLSTNGGADCHCLGAANHGRPLFWAHLGAY